jgi:hypothetical protein
VCSVTAGSFIAASAPLPIFRDLVGVGRATLGRAEDVRIVGEASEAERDAMLELRL